MTVTREEIKNKFYDILKVPHDDSWGAIIQLIRLKNYQTAVAWMFELSWHGETGNREWLQRAHGQFKDWADKFDFKIPEAPITNDEEKAHCNKICVDIYNWMQWYINNVEKLPQ